MSAGFGYKTKHYVFDLGYANIRTNGNYQFYDGAIASLEKSNHIVQATFGIRF